MVFEHGIVTLGEDAESKLRGWPAASTDEVRITNRVIYYERRHVLVLNSKTRQNSKTLYFRPNLANLTYSIYTSY
jgi:hypothetical protein